MQDFIIVVGVLLAFFAGVLIERHDQERQRTYQSIICQKIENERTR